MTNIISKIRYLIKDPLDTTLYDSFTYYTDNIFRLSESNVSESSIAVYVNSVLKSSENYTVNSDTWEITYSGSLTSGDAVKITYSAYTKFSDTELTKYIKSALIYISLERYKTFFSKSDNKIFPTPSESEKNLIALISNILINENIKSYKTIDTNIVFNEKETKEEKINRVISQYSKSTGAIDYIDLNEKTTAEIDEEDE